MGEKSSIAGVEMERMRPGARKAAIRLSNCVEALDYVRLDTLLKVFLLHKNDINEFS